MKLISCSSNYPLAVMVSDYLGIPLMEVNIKRFADQEIFVEILDNVRGEDVFVIPLRGIKPSELQKSWEPGPIANSKFTKAEMAKITKFD